MCPSRPDHGPNQKTTPETQSSPQQARQSRSHRPRHHRETAEYQGTHQHLKTSHRHTCLAATRICGPNPKLRAEDRSSPHRHRATNHSTTTKPRNTNNPMYKDDHPSSDEPLKPPESADQIGNRNHKTNPVHNRTTNHHQPAATVTSENHEFPTNRPHHHYHISSAQSPTLTEPRTKLENDTPNPIQSTTDPTATRQSATILPQKPRNTNNLINTRRTATGTPATQPTKSADRTANHTTTSEPVHTDAHQHRATNHDTTTKPRNTNNPHTPR